MQSSVLGTEFAPVQSMIQRDDQIINFTLNNASMSQYCGELMQI